jgi:hypothetical protein
VSRDFLLYWKPNTVDEVKDRLRNEPLGRVSSDQLDRIQPGDLVWIITVRSRGKLVVVGRLRVDEILTKKQAIGTRYLWVTVR